MKQKQSESAFCPLLPGIRKSLALCGGSQGSPACPSGKSSLMMKRSVENCRNDTDREKQNYCRNDTDREKQKYCRNDTDREKQKYCRNDTDREKQKYFFTNLFLCHVVH